MKHLYRTIFLVFAFSACGRTIIVPEEPIPPGYVRVTVQPNHLISQIGDSLKRVHFIGDLTVEAALNNNEGEKAVDRALTDATLRGEFSIASSSLEGYIIAGNYYIDPKKTAHEALRLMLKKSFSRFADEGRREKANELGISPKQILTMASIIQRETCGKDEMPKMASVLYNRMGKSMPLQVDVTLLYLLGRWDGRITKEELKIKSPYNTYVSKGLPPTPIGSPSIDAIDSVLNPNTSSYLFFAASGKCQHFFSEDYREHEDFVSRNLRNNNKG